MEVMGEAKTKLIDDDWVSLILIAKQIGLTQDEVRKFIRKQQSIQKTQRNRSLLDKYSSEEKEIR
ncbi:DNA-binding anti-repressor SinI [Virgibacillus sp. FSP13]